MSLSTVERDERTEGPSKTSILPSNSATGLLDPGGVPTSEPSHEGTILNGEGGKSLFLRAKTARTLPCSSSTSCAEIDDVGVGTTDPFLPRDRLLDLTLISSTCKEVTDVGVGGNVLSPYAFTLSLVGGTKPCSCAVFITSPYPFTLVEGSSEIEPRLGEGERDWGGDSDLPAGAWVSEER